VKSVRKHCFYLEDRRWLESEKKSQEEHVGTYRKWSTEVYGYAVFYSTIFHSSTEKREKQKAKSKSKNKPGS
jgi:hypothetical protein